jgi:hypothetical protein
MLLFTPTWYDGIVTDGRTPPPLKAVPEMTPLDVIATPPTTVTYWRLLTSGGGGSSDRVAGVETHIADAGWYAPASPEPMKKDCPCAASTVSKGWVRAEVPVKKDELNCFTLGLAAMFAKMES